MSLRIREVDYADPRDADAVVAVLDSYASDPVGGGRGLPADVRGRLVPSADSEIERENTGRRLVRMLSLEAPATAIALIEELGLDRRSGWTRAPMALLARTDAAAGRAFAERTSAEPFDLVRGTVGTVLAEQDPDATIAWLRSLDPMPADLAKGVVSGVARVDPLRAIELGEELSVTGALDRVDTLAQSASLIAERVLAVQDPVRRDEWLESLLQGWGWVDDVAAMDWAILNADRLSPELFERLGQAQGNEDPEAALYQTTRLPEQAQSGWVRSVMRGVMGPDPVAALDWVGQFRGQSFYDAAAAAVVSSASWEDNAPVRDVFETLSDDGKAAVAQGFASNWFRQDPDAVRAWVTGLAAGPVRDEALTGYLVGALSRGQGNPRYPPPFGDRDESNESLMELYSSRTARAEAVIGMIDSVARRDAAEARRLVDAYVEDSGQRERAELLLQGARR